MTLFTRDQLDNAHEIVRRRMAPTPQFQWPLLSRRLGTELWVKHENHTPTGAFKVRGGMVYLDDLAGTDCPGLITATRGNHGQSIPFAAAPHGLPVTVYVPEGNSVEKNAAMKAWGATLCVHGADFEEARDECERHAAAEGLHMVPSFHPLLVRGVATYALEFLLGAAPDVVYVPIGMGSGICGLITARDLLGAKTEIVGVVSEGADAYALSFDAGRVVETNRANTFADGIACRAPMAEALEIILAGAARIVRVSDDEVADAIRAYYTDTHNLAEGAGAASLAAAMQERGKLAGKRVGVILCGGNIDTAWMQEILAGRTPVPQGSDTALATTGGQ
ncbi:threonine dehydratase [Rhodobacteraceae bacterium NNCM2]|nr:threonine dehydratase [Coraliihabitans acroporae]